MERWQFLALPNRRDLSAELLQPGMANNGPAMEKLGLTSEEGGGCVTRRADLLTVRRKQLLMHL